MAVEVEDQRRAALDDLGAPSTRFSAGDSGSYRSLTRVAYQIVDSARMTAERGPHPAASPFDKRVSQKLGVSAFEVYQVELPPGAETVRHTHLADQVEDVYAFIRGEGWVVVDDEHVPVRPGQFVAVTVESARQVRAGDDGLAFIALCAPPR